MKNKSMRIPFILVVFFALLLGSNAYAGKLVYQLEGSNPSLLAMKLNMANAQNDFKGPSSYQEKSQLQQFEERLMSSVLSTYSRNVSDQLFDENGNFVEGTITIGDFSVIATSGDLGGIQLVISDGVGGSTTITLPAVQFD